MLYSEYLKTHHWQDTRQARLNHRPFCQVCDSTKNLHIHHKKYKDKLSGKSILFNEGLTDLITLCGSCHRLMHHHFGIEVKKINKKILRIRRLMEYKIDKKMAFYITTQDALYNSIRDNAEKLERYIGN